MDYAHFNPAKATLGFRLKWFRRRLGEPIAQWATKTGVSHGAISRLEADKIKNPKPAILGKILAAIKRYGADLPDPYDWIVPPNSFGGWLQNLRLRHGLKQKDLGRILGLSKAAIYKLEKDQMRASQATLNQLLKHFKESAPPITECAPRT